MSRKLLVGLLALMVVAAGCVPVTPDAGAPSAAMEPSVLAVENETLGQFLADAAGMTLYILTRDEPGMSNCYNGCAAAWPPLSVEGEPVAGEGVDASLLGTTERTDGTVQVTYNGWPLYYWARDQNPGDTTGQDVGGVWFVITPAGEIVRSTVKVTQTEELGQFLADAAGMTLYIFTNDEPGMSNCYDGCAAAWPPLLVEGAPIAGQGVGAALLGTTERTDGTTQVTYNGWPLYYWAQDQAPGDTTGQDVGGVWFVITPAGEIVR